jgi:protein O-GlcNAc transferase
MTTIDEALGQAAQHYQAGQFALAEQLCRQILQADPAHPYALHLLGLLAFQARRWDDAVACCAAALRVRPDLAEVYNSLGAALMQRNQHADALSSFQEAVRLKPDYADAHHNEGTVYQQMGQWQQAETSYRSALRFRPDFAQAHHNLGALLVVQGRPAEAAASYQAALACWPDYFDAHINLGSVLKQMGRLEEAESCFRAALRLRPELADVHSSLGGILADRGQFPAALECLQEALRLQPTLAGAHTNLGNVLKQMGRTAEAEESYREALRHDPAFHPAHNNLGLLLMVQGKLIEAMACFQEAVRVRPDYHDAHANLGDVLKLLGRPEEAMASYRTSLRIRPYFTQAHNNLGVLLAVQGQFAESEEIFRDAVRLWPMSPEPYYNLGIAIADQNRPEEALACYEQALRLRPDYAEALNNTAFIYRQQGRIDEALAYNRKAAALQPDQHYLYSNLLLTLHYPATYDPEAVFAEHVRWAEQVEGRGARGEGRGTDEGRYSDSSPIETNRRLRIGYVSGDFREHVMGRYSEAVIAAHDRSQFEVFCYANIRRQDEYTQRIKATADHWRPIFGVSDAQVVELIRGDQIDLLIDLSGHTADNRVTVFAHKPAPVQVTHCGYPDTTGLAAIDYRLTDPYCDPPGKTERYHTEKVVRLPEAHWCYAPPPTPEVAPVPAQEAGVVTFASFNFLAKVTEAMIGLWARILHALPRARMVVQAGAGRTGDERVRAAFARHGIPEERVTLAGKVKSDEYYRRFGEADICLDTHPYAGCNTTADALWMGVPVVTLAGPTCVTRLGASAIVLAGLEDLVTETPEAYVETAICLAQDLPRLRALRGQLRDRVKQTLGNVDRFTRQLEAVYREMWQTYCAGSGT